MFRNLFLAAAAAASAVTALALCRIPFTFNQHEKFVAQQQEEWNRQEMKWK